MQGRRRIATAGWALGAGVVLTALASCSSTTDAPPSARELVGRLVDAKVCGRPQETSPGSDSNSWTCLLSRRTPTDRPYVSVTSFASAAALRRSVARSRPRCPSEVVLSFLRGPAWMAVVAPRTRRDVALVRRTLGGHDLVLRCAHPTATPTIPAPGGAGTSSTTASTSTTTIGSRTTSPSRPYLPPPGSPPAPMPPFRIDVPPPTPVITAPAGPPPPSTAPPGTIHSSGG